MHLAFQDSDYCLVRQWLSFPDRIFRFYGGSGDLRLYCRMKGFRLREDLRVFADETMTNQLLSIKARQIIDFAAAFDVVDTVSGEPVGTLKRKGLKSMLRDLWIAVNAAGQEFARIQEESAGRAFARRFLFNLLPGTHLVTVGERPVASFRQRFNPFHLRMDVNLEAGTPLDPRLGLAAALLLAGIEGRQR